jgi:hypothetical protein
MPFARTELYFGTARPDGVVSEAQFRDPFIVWVSF